MTPREKAATELVAILDSDFLRALTEPARLELLRVMLLHGPADIGTLAGHLPQDRSVISRHLATLERAGVVTATAEGRRRVYALDGAGFLRSLEGILGTTRRLVDVCCPPAPRLGSSTRSSAR